MSSHRLATRNSHLSGSDDRSILSPSKASVDPEPADESTSPLGKQPRLRFVHRFLLRTVVGRLFSPSVARPVACQGQAPSGSAAPSLDRRRALASSAAQGGQTPPPAEGDSTWSRSSITSVKPTSMSSPSLSRKKTSFPPSPAPAC